MMGRRLTVVGFPEDAPASSAVLDERLHANASITQVILIQRETGAGVWNPLVEVAQACERHGKGLIADAESSFGALPIDAREVRFDALISASGKCLEGVPGMGFVFIRKAIVDGCAGRSQSLAMDLHDQHVCMEQTVQWHFTPPAHVVAALAEAIAQFVEEGGQDARHARYTESCRTLIDGMRTLGLKPFLKAEHQAPIIVTFHAPEQPAYDFKRFCAAAKARSDLWRCARRCRPPPRRWPRWASRFRAGTESL